MRNFFVFWISVFFLLFPFPCVSQRTNPDSHNLDTRIHIVDTEVEPLVPDEFTVSPVSLTRLSCSKISASSFVRWPDTDEFDCSMNPLSDILNEKTFSAATRICLAKFKEDPDAYLKIGVKYALELHVLIVKLFLELGKNAAECIFQALLENLDISSEAKNLIVQATEALEARDDFIEKKEKILKFGTLDAIEKWKLVAKTKELYSEALESISTFLDLGAATKDYIKIVLQGGNEGKTRDILKDARKSANSCDLNGADGLLIDLKNIGVPALADLRSAVRRTQKQRLCLSERLYNLWGRNWKNVARIKDIPDSRRYWEATNTLSNLKKRETAQSLRLDQAANLCERLHTVRSRISGLQRKHAQLVGRFKKDILSASCRFDTVHRELDEILALENDYCRRYLGAPPPGYYLSWDLNKLEKACKDKGLSAGLAESNEKGCPPVGDYTCWVRYKITEARKIPDPDKRRRPGGGTAWIHQEYNYIGWKPVKVSHSLKGIRSIVFRSLGLDNSGMGSPRNPCDLDVQLNPRLGYTLRGDVISMQSTKPKIPLKVPRYGVYIEENSTGRWKTIKVCDTGLFGRDYERSTLASGDLLDLNPEISSTGSSQTTASSSWEESRNRTMDIIQGHTSSSYSQPSSNSWERSAQRTRDSFSGTPSAASLSFWARPEVRRTMDMWLNQAVPLRTAGDGSPLRYNRFGQLIGRGIMSAGAPDTQGRSREEYLWSISKKLTSRNLCSMYEFVQRTLRNESIAGCKIEGHTTRSNSVQRTPTRSVGHPAQIIAGIDTWINGRPKIAGKKTIVLLYGLDRVSFKSAAAMQYDRATFKRAGWQMVAIGLADHFPWSKLKEYIFKNGILFPVGMGNSTVIRQLNLNVTGEVIVLDESGDIVGKLSRYDRIKVARIKRKR